MVSRHISFNFGSVTGSNEGSCLGFQLVFISSLLTRFDEVMSSHQYRQGCDLSNAKHACYLIVPSQGVYNRQMFVDVLVFQCCLVDTYDRSSWTRFLNADMHCHLFREIKMNQQDKGIGIAAYYHDVRVITCSRLNSNQVMWDDDIEFFVVCFQIFSLETGIVPYLYRGWVFSRHNKFRQIVLNVVNEITTYQINRLYLVAHYAESHLLDGQCRVKAESMF